MDVAEAEAGPLKGPEGLTKAAAEREESLTPKQRSRGKCGP